VRSGITCYNTAHKFTFDAELIKPAGSDNVLTLSLPPGASGSSGKAKLPSQLYIQYDALRLEVEV
jgi:rhamnogalacturonan endolyase